MKQPHQTNSSSEHTHSVHPPKTALVCDWLTNVGGAEKVLLAIHHLYPDAPIYTSQYRPKGIGWFKDADVRTGWLQIFPSSLRRFLGPLRQHYFSHLDLSEYDLVISVTGAEAKSVKTHNEKTGQRARHLCYCHVPTQYYWQMYDEYLENPGFGILNPVVRFFFKALVGPLRAKDLAAAKKVDEFVTISEYARELIKKYYHREAKTIHPPVDTSNFSIKGKKSQVHNTSQNKQGNNNNPKSQIAQGNKLTKSQAREIQALVENFHDYYIVTSRQVTWKRLDLAIKACLELGKNLLVIGEGPEHHNLTKLAAGAENVRFLPLQGQASLAAYLQSAKAYLFPSLEPFGIAPVEALAAGCPVVAYGKGGSRDYIIPGKNGLLFDQQTAKSLAAAIQKFEAIHFSPSEVSATADPFTAERFDQELQSAIKELLK